MKRKRKNKTTDKERNYKLPSYASCLNAKINPKNYLKLKDYFEMAVKDHKIAELN